MTTDIKHSVVSLCDIEIKLTDGSTVKPLSFVPAAIKLTRFEKPHSSTPIYNENYVFDTNAWLELVSAFAAIEHFGMRPGLMIIGSPGVGKSIGLNQLAAILNRPVFGCTGRDDMDLTEIVGRFLPKSKDGGTSMTYLDGPLIQALKTPYSIFLAEEFDRIRPDVSVNFNTVLDGYCFFHDDLNKRIELPPGFTMACTANGNGQGDQSGLCSTSQIIDFSTMDRFSSIIELEFPSEEVQFEILKNAATPIKGAEQMVNDESIKKIIEFGGKCRVSFNTGGANSLPAPVTIRTQEDIISQIILFGEGKPGATESRWKFWLDKAFVAKVASKHAPQTKGIREAIYGIARACGFDKTFANDDKTADPSAAFAN